MPASSRQETPYAMPLLLSHFDSKKLIDALHSAKCTSGSTHNFYLYPARFSPEIARAVIADFSCPGDWILDPFMGGGTAVVEAIALGRNVLGVDLNALSHFVAKVRTTPLSSRDEDDLVSWAHSAGEKRSDYAGSQKSIDVVNLPGTVRDFMRDATAELERLRFPRQRAFARCALLRLGQWAVDCRDAESPPRARLAERLTTLTAEMLDGLRDFVDECRRAGVTKNRIAACRLLMCRDASSLNEDPVAHALRGRIRLVFTSPPYPGVHVLYHRWQVRGRRETSAPYWIAQVPDGYYASHYTGGSRTPVGLRHYFEMVRKVFAAVRNTLTPDGVVVQLVGFADFDTQYPAYMQAMEDAGFDACPTAAKGKNQLGRRVPNRKWYAKLGTTGDAASELLLFHRPKLRHRAGLAPGAAAE